jgi:hypothetical protein
MSLRKAARQNGVPKTTLIDRLAERSGEKLWRSIVLNKEEEDFLMERILMMGERGFPLGKRDLRHLIKNYLDRQGKTTR